MYTTCLKLGCNELVKPPEKYCSKHKHIEIEKKKERNRHYDKYSRNKLARSFYSSMEWKTVRRVVLVRDNYLCQECLRQGKVTKANAVHHIEELLDVWDKRLDIDNLESICNKCHNKEKKKKG